MVNLFYLIRKNVAVFLLLLIVSLTYSCKKGLPGEEETPNSKMMK